MRLNQLLSNIHRVTVFMGISQLYRNPDCPKFLISKWRILYSSFVAIALCIFGGIHFTQSYIEFSDATQFFGYKLWSLGLFICSVAAVINSIMYRKEAQCAINKILSLSCTLTTVTGTPTEVKSWKYLILGGCYGLILLFSGYESLFTLYILEYFGIIFLFMLPIIWGIFLIMIHALYQHLLQVFIITMENDRGYYSISSLSKQKYKGPMEFRAITALYHDLYELSRSFDEIFAYPNLIMLLHMSFSTLFVFYGRITEAILFNGIYGIHLFQAFVWVPFGLISLLLLVHPCELIYAQRDEMKRTVHKYTTMSEKSITGDELQRFATLIYQENHYFSPCGILTLSKRTLLTIISFVLSYLAFLSQLPHRGSRKHINI